MPILGSGLMKINIDDLAISIEEILDKYSDKIFFVTEEGLEDAEKVLINNLKAASPKDSGEFAKSWKGKGKKYKLRRYVGNTKMVEGKKGFIPLSNILEYSTVRGKPFIKDTYEKSIPEMRDAIIKSIERKD
jgi:hypothetical protein